MCKAKINPISKWQLAIKYLTLYVTTSWVDAMNFDFFFTSNHIFDLSRYTCNHEGHISFPLIIAGKELWRHAHYFIKIQNHILWKYFLYTFEIKNVTYSRQLFIRDGIHIFNSLMVRWPWTAMVFILSSWVA